MINIIPIQKAYKDKIRRQEKLSGLKFYSHGSCAYVGNEISPGCYGCFFSDDCHFSFMLGRDFGLPNVCNRNCIYCFEPHRVSQSPLNLEGWKLSEGYKEILRKVLYQECNQITTDKKMSYYEFSGVCEPLLYLPIIENCMKFFRNELDRLLNNRGWAKLYTNGTLLNEDNILKLQEMGFDEIRIHPGASDFSPSVYSNIEMAVKYIPVITVENPSWPNQRQKIFDMLPILEELKVKHLNICQIEIASKYQLEKIEEALGTVNIYQAYYPMVDDDGLVEEIIKEVLNKGYSYSVLDCNGFVKQSKSALTKYSYWSMINRKYPSKWEKHRIERFDSKNRQVINWY